MTFVSSVVAVMAVALVLLYHVNKGGSNGKHSDAIAKGESTDVAKVESRVLVQGNGWGYDILVDGKVYVRQPHIPAVAGLGPFRTREAAQAVALLVIQKLSLGIVPPSVTKAELDSLGVLM